MSGQYATVLTDFFPELLLSALSDQVGKSPQRKQEFTLRDENTVPECVSEAAAYASQRLELAFNVAILKWYRVDDEYESKAYDAHRDPDNLTSIPVFLGTLKGEANLIYWTPENQEVSVRCVENTVVLLEPRLLHRVTPPLSTDGERFFLFLGLDTSL